MGFGNVSDYLGYNALADFFPQMSLKPNPSCDDRNCIKRQEEFNIEKAKQEKDTVKDDGKHETEVIHADNEFGKYPYIFVEKRKVI